MPVDVDWKAVADPGDHDFYMSGRTAAQIAGRLIAEGLPPGCPAVVATAVSRPGQRLRQCTLGGLAATVEAGGRGDSVILGIGSARAAPARDGLR